MTNTLTPAEDRFPRNLVVRTGPGDGQQSTLLSRCRSASPMTASGHFDQFPATSPSVSYLFGQETVAGATPDGRSAP
jgi:hypothetical protein